MRIGIGDDAAVLAPPAGHDLVVATDTLVAGVHFPHATKAEDIGWKSLAVNLSDLAAMGATPAWALLALTLPSADTDFVERFADGFAALAAQHHVALVGGDTTSGPLTISVTVLGFVPPGQAILRDGARAGDWVFVTGTVGDAAAALRCMEEKQSHAMTSASSANGVYDALERVSIARRRASLQASCCVARHRRASMCRTDSSPISVTSRGRVVSASSSTAAELPASPALLQTFDAQERLALQATGGDDYELAFTLAPAREAETLRDLAKIGCGATRIGRVVDGAGVRLLDENGAEIRFERDGWTHFA